MIWTHLVRYVSNCRLWWLFHQKWLSLLTRIMHSLIYIYICIILYIYNYIYISTRNPSWFPCDELRTAWKSHLLEFHMAFLQPILNTKPVRKLRWHIWVHNPIQIWAIISYDVISEFACHHNSPTWSLFPQNSPNPTPIIPTACQLGHDKPSNDDQKHKPQFLCWVVNMSILIDHW